MKVLFAVLALLALACAVSQEMLLTAEGNHDCPHDLEVKCIDDINKAYPPCKKAAEKQGKDFPADLECLKYSVYVEKDCWPCICWIAEQEKWKIRGC